MWFSKKAEPEIKNVRAGGLFGMIPEKRGDQEIKTGEEETAMGKVCPYNRSGRASSSTFRRA